MVQYHSRVGRLVSWLVDQVRCGNLISSDHLVISSRALARSWLNDWLIDWQSREVFAFVLSLLSSTSPRPPAGRDVPVHTVEPKQDKSVHPSIQYHSLIAIPPPPHQSLTHSLAKTTKVQKKKENKKETEKKKERKKKKSHVHKHTITVAPYRARIFHHELRYSSCHLDSITMRYCSSSATPSLPFPSLPFLFHVPCGYGG